MSKLRHIFFTLCFLLGNGLSSSVFAEPWLKPGPPTISIGQGVLWRIQGAAEQDSYLLGTIHSDDARLYPLPNALQQVLDQVDSLSLEVDMSLAVQIRMAQLMFSNEKASLLTQLGKKDFMRVADLLGQHGILVTDAMRLHPWAALIIISMPKTQNTNNILDMHLYHRAKENGKTLHGLEEPEEQIQGLSSFSIDEQISLLRMTLELYPQQQEMLDEMHRLYLKRDLDGLLQYSREQMLATPHPLNEAFIQALLIKRNARMLERMLPRLKEGNALIAVGSLHLVGQNGLVHQLRQRGLKVEAMY